MKKLFTGGALALAAVAAFGIGTIAVTMAHAQDNSQETTFIEKLAEKLGLNSEDVQTAFEEIKEEHKAEKAQEFEAAVQEAQANGDLTDKQVQIVKAMQEIRENSDFEKPDRSQFEGLTEEERKDLMDSMHEERVQSMIDTLKSDYNIDVTQDELEALRTTLQDLGIGGHHEHRGPGFGGEF